MARFAELLSIYIAKFRSRSISNHLSSYTYTFSPSLLILTEFFNPSQVHMIAVSEGLKLFHAYTGLDWTASLICSTFLLRTAIALPLYTYTEKNQALVYRAYASAVTDHELKSSLVRNLNANLVSSKQSSLRSNFLKQCREHNCHPLKSTVFGIVQLPLWVTLTFGLRNICGINLSQFIYWQPMIPEFVIDGLTLPTTSPALILLLTSLNILNVEICHLRRISAAESMLSCNKSPTESQKLPFRLRLVRGLGLGGSLFISVLSLFTPSALALFWCTSAAHQFLLHTLHSVPRLRRLLGIPSSPQGDCRQLSSLLQTAKQHYRIIGLFSSK